MDEGEAKEYKASLWVREGEDIIFAIKFTTGSHVKTTIYLDGETTCNCAFPFRHNDVMFYGCPTGFADPLCPVEVDSNFNPVGDLESCLTAANRYSCPWQSKYIFPLIKYVICISYLFHHS